MPLDGAIPLDANTTLRWLSPVYARLLDATHWESAVSDSAAQFHHIFDSVPHGIVVFSAKGTEAKVNEGAANLLGLPSGSVPVDLAAQAMRDTRSKCENASELEHSYASLLGDLDTTIVVDWYLKDSVWRVDTHPILQTGLKGRVWLFQDITAQVRLERVLRMEASHDSLTGLLNRRAFFDRAQVAYQHTDDLQQLALVLFDIDHFKQVNDLYGHPTGDQVLKEVAHRAKLALRDGDVLARYGGEEFIVLLTTAHKEAIYEAAERLRSAVGSQPVQVNNLALDIRISLGLSFREGHAETLQQTIGRADSNLYRAKRGGRNRVVRDGD